MFEKWNENSWRRLCSRKRESTYQSGKGCLQELKENERIMMLDTSGMNEDQRTFYDGLKKEILAKKSSSHSLGWDDVGLFQSYFGSN